MKNEKQLVKHNEISIQPPPINVEITDESIERMQRNREKFKKLIESILQEGVHFTRRPGYDKPALEKPGAEVVVGTFNCYPKIIEIKRDNLENNHYSITISVGIYNRFNQQLVASGVGSCSSKESKYIKTIKTKNNRSRQRGDDIQIDCEDIVNTITKMAMKRAVVDASMYLGCISEFFTQDLDTLPEKGKGDGKSSVAELEKEINKLMKNVSKEKRVEIVKRMADLKKKKQFTKVKAEEIIKYLQKGNGNNDIYKNMTIEEFCKLCRELKEEIRQIYSDHKEYYEVLKKFKCKHANEVSHSQYRDVALSLTDVIRQAKEELAENEKKEDKQQMQKLTEKEFIEECKRYKQKLNEIFGNDEDYYKVLNVHNIKHAYQALKAQFDPILRDLDVLMKESQV